MQCFGQMMTPAHISAQRGDVDCVQAFIQAGFDMNVKGTRNQTILHVATISRIKMMEYILHLEGGANLVNASDEKGFAPVIHVATTFARPNHRTREVVQLLLQHGADIHARDNSGNMAAHHFAGMG